MLAHGGDNAGRVEPAGIQHRLPIDVPGLDHGHRGVSAVIGLIAGTGTDAHLNKAFAVAPVPSDLVIRRDHHIGHIHTMHLSVLDDVVSVPGVHQLGHKAGLELRFEQLSAQVGDIHTAVEFRRRDPQLELLRLSQSVVAGRCKTDHRFAKAHEIILCHNICLLFLW